MLHELSRTFLSWVLIFPSAYLAGSFFQPLVCRKDAVFRGILYYALGLAVLSYGVVALSGLRLLSPVYIWIMLSLPVLLRINKFWEWLLWMKEAGRGLLPQKSVFSKIFSVFFLISFLCLLMGTLTPEIGGDALCYQLNLPKVFLRQGSLAPDLLDFNSYFPLLMNNLYLIGLATGGVFAAKLFHLLCGLLLFLAVKRILEIETRSRFLPYFIALVVWTTPAVHNLLSTTYIDVALAFYTFLAVVVFCEALRGLGKSCFYLSGVLAGCAVAMKYLALMSVVGLLAVWLWDLLAQRRIRAHIEGGFFFATGILTVAGYWFVRNGLITGNPFFPYFGELFGVAHHPPTDFYLFGFGWSWFHYLSLYFNMFLVPDHFGAFPTRIGIFYFLFLPFLYGALLFVPRARGYGIFWLVFTGVIFFIAQADRWIIPVLPVMAVCAGMGIHWLYGRASVPLKRFMKFGWGSIAILILSVYVLAGIFHYRYAYRLFAGQWSIEDYRTSLERTTTIADWINKNLPSNAKILVESEPRTFYFDRPAMRKIFMKWRLKDSEVFESPQAFTRFLKTNGFTHILTTDLIKGGKVVSKSLTPDKARYSPPFAKEIYAVESRNIREDRYRYTVYEIQS